MLMKAGSRAKKANMAAIRINQQLAPGRRVGERYIQATAGRGVDLGMTWYRSKAERNYARYLRWQRESFLYEPKVFIFSAIRSGKNRAYKPDFYISRLNEWHEVKGWMDADSKIKLERMRRFYPMEKVLVIDSSFFKAVERQRLCRLVPGWECSHNANLSKK